MIFDFDPEKNKVLKRTRNISFEDIIEEIENGENILDIIPHSNQERYPLQKIFIIKMKGYLYSIPFIEGEGKIFFKTIFPDRRLLKKYPNILIK